MKSGSWGSFRGLGSSSLCLVGVRNLVLLSDSLEQVPPLGLVWEMPLGSPAVHWALSGDQRTQTGFTEGRNLSAGSRSGRAAWWRRPKMVQERVFAWKSGALGLSWPHPLASCDSEQRLLTDLSTDQISVSPA